MADITNVSRGLINRFVSSAAPSSPSKFPPLPEGIGFIGDYAEWNDPWLKSADQVLKSKGFKGSSPIENIELFKKEVRMRMEEFERLGSNTQRDSPINYARKIYDEVRQDYGKRVGSQLKGIQLHHAIDELAARPQEALDGANLIFARGNAATEGTLHWILHEMNNLKKAGIANPGRRALLNAVDKGLISEKVLSPTLRTPSTKATSTVKAAAAESVQPSRPSDEHLQLSQQSTEVGVAGSTEYGGVIKRTLERAKDSFTGFGGGEDSTKPSTPPRAPADVKGTENQNRGLWDDIVEALPWTRKTDNRPKTKEEAERRASQEYFKHKKEHPEE